MWSLYLVQYLALYTAHSMSQSTSAENDCYFHDEETGSYHISVTKDGLTNCHMNDVLSKKTKALEESNAQLEYTVQQLQVTAKELIAQNRQLTNRIAILEAKTQNAVKKIEVAGNKVNELEKLTNTDPNTGCPLGYVRNNELKSCYLFVTRYMKWYQAETFCMTQGAHLVAIESSQEQTFIMQHIKSNSQELGRLDYWTSGNDIAKEGDYVWAKTNKGFTYTNWSTMHINNRTIHQPDNHYGQEHCINMHFPTNYEWNDILCNFVFSFICEKPMMDFNSV